MALKALVKWLGSPSEVSPEKQAEAAERIIAAGRRHGAKKIKLKIDRNAGAKVKARANGEGIHVEGGFGVDGVMDLEIEYV